ncbi:hypothetical protein HMPREF0526_10403 [Lactobacillus jensenii JV-V16]|nr:hypothetical protein HMPREF0526_10403 [Lactobacillus jensenii JV-V16]
MINPANTVIATEFSKVLGKVCPLTLYQIKQANKITNSPTQKTCFLMKSILTPPIVIKILYQAFKV